MHGRPAKQVRCAAGGYPASRYQTSTSEYVIPVRETPVSRFRTGVRACGCEILEIGCRGGTHAEDAYKSLGFVEWGRLPGGYHDRDQTYDEVNLFLRV